MAIYSCNYHNFTSVSKYCDYGKIVQVESDTFYCDDDKLFNRLKSKYN